MRKESNNEVYARLSGKPTSELTRADLQEVFELARRSGRVSDRLLYVNTKAAVEDNERQQQQQQQDTNK